MNTSTRHANSLLALHASFLAIVPRIERHGRFYFRNVKDPAKREEFVAEMVGISWRWFRRLVERGKDAAQFPSAIAGYAARAVRGGRRVCGQERSKDVMSSLAQRRRGFTVGKLLDYEMLSDNPLCDALIDNTVTPVDEQVAFRLDFPQWVSTYSERNRGIILDLMAGERTLEVSDKYALSPGRVSQMRGQFCDSWRRFQDGVTADA